MKRTLILMSVIVALGSATHVELPPEPLAEPSTEPPSEPFTEPPMEPSTFLSAGVLASTSRPKAEAHVVRLPNDPDFSPDGLKVVFAWHGDIWIASSGGGIIRQITSATASDSHPKFSPNGKEIAFISTRNGSQQVYVVPVTGGDPEQLTFHSDGYSLEQWTSQGSFLVSGSRDQFWRKPSRFFVIDRKMRPREDLVFDAYGADGRVSSDGRKLVFTREGTQWWRKGYRGSQASQVWMYDRDSSVFTMLSNPETGARSPLWHRDGKSVIYVGGQSGSFNLWQKNIESGEEKQLTQFKDDTIVMPCISRDGKNLMFRHLFDFYRMELSDGAKPEKVTLNYRGDSLQDRIVRQVVTTATDATFSKDGLEIAFIAGGDLWVMDTVLREPIQVTDTAEEEREPIFAPDGKAILYLSDNGGECDIWRVRRNSEDKYWWQTKSFVTDQLTKDSDVESNISWSPDGKQVAYCKVRGDLWVMDSDGKSPKRILESWNVPDYDWSPDSKWVVYTVSDNDFNRDVHILPLDGSRPAFNLSSHPDNDYGPAWSPDGKVIAFTGRRVGTESDIYFVYLEKSKSEEGSRDRKLDEALKKMKGARSKTAPSTKKQTPATKEASTAKQDPKAAEKEAEKKSEPSEKKDATPPVPQVKIDFEGIHERVRRVSIPDTFESQLLWSPDSKKLAFSANIDAKAGLYTIELPSELRPKLMASTVGRGAKWLSKGNQIVWLSGGSPASLSSAGKATSYSFSARQSVDMPARYKAAFDLCWREMRDNFYDGAMNNRNWDEIRRKYSPLAESAVDVSTLGTVINLMLGEINGSHLGFYPSGGSSSSSNSGWREVTAHFGARYDTTYKGPGLKVRDVVVGTPAAEEKSKLEPNDVILSIGGVAVDPAMELTSVLNGPLDRDIELRVKNEKGDERTVTIRPTSSSVVRSRLYEHWIDSNQKMVDKLSEGRFGYVHIKGMNMTSFYRFENELYSVGAGKDALVIDVRENGGGSTTDHLLTILTQPTHAITVPRGGGTGYPHDRRIYATWNKPIIVLCNQNSFSNAEIFSHSIKTLKRGQVVGVPTAGGVISTGGSRIMDIGFLRKPFRGWYLVEDGEDMELNGAIPHHILWPKPGDMPKGKDDQLSKAVSVLKGDVEKWKNRPQPNLINSSQRKKKD